MRLVARALVMWLVLLVVMVGNGTLRVLVLQPRLGESLARQVATLAAIGLVIGLSLPFVRRCGRADARALLGVGALWVTLTLAFELGFGALAGKTLAEMLEDYALWRGRLWPLFLVATLVGPWLWRGSAAAG